MSESEPSSTAQPIQGFTESLKWGSRGGRILSLSDREYMRELRLSAWSVRWVLSVRVSAKPKRLRVEASVLATITPREKGSYVVYRRQMLELLRWPKPTFDQLAIELPCLMGFRAKEVTTWRAEWIDWQNGDTQVLDAKKHRLYTVPLNTSTSKYAEQVLNGRSEGYVLQSRSNRQTDPDRPISPIAVWYIWNKWIQRVIGSGPGHISPVVGRRFFAAEWYYGQGLSLVTLSRILRHSDPTVTMRYVQSLVFHEDVKRDYDRFQLGLMQEKGVTM